MILNNLFWKLSSWLPGISPYLSCEAGKHFWVDIPTLHHSSYVT